MGMILYYDKICLYEVKLHFSKIIVKTLISEAFLLKKTISFLRLTSLATTYINYRAHFRLTFAINLLKIAMW